MSSLYNYLSRAATQNKHKKAIVFGEKHLSYIEFKDKVDQIAFLLKRNNISYGDRIAVIQYRNPTLLATMFALLKLGATYVPIEPAMPDKRKELILHDSQVNYVISDTGEHNYPNGVKIIDLKELDKNDDKVRYNSELDKDLSESIAYIIYTSGSTGKPKGVMIKQKSLINLLINGMDPVGLAGDRTIACLSNISFDMSVPEFLLPLCKGLTVVLANEEQQKNPALTSRLLINNNVDTLLIAPTRLEMLATYDNEGIFLSNIKTLLFGAEIIPNRLLDLIRNKSNAQIYNLYGPTETTAYTTYSNITRKNIIDIGTPIKNTQVFILDENQNKAPVGTKGEICITGVGVGVGYVNQKELTNRKFIINKHLASNRIYRTGDLGVMLEDGSIQYLGRIDNQVKYKGHRIELEEIEKKISKYSGVRQCVVVINKDKTGNQWLSAYYTGSHNIDETSLMSFLNEEFPTYMIPNYYSQMEKLPMNHNGKIDRGKLEEKEIIIKTVDENVSTHKISDDVSNKTIRIINSILNSDYQDTSLSLVEMGIDSVRFIKLIVELEQAFNIEFDDEVLIYNHLTTIDNLISLIKECKLTKTK